MLVLSRRAGEAITIELDPNAHPNRTAAELFAQGPITIKASEVGPKAVRLAIRADARWKVLRSELARHVPASISGVADQVQISAGPAIRGRGKSHRAGGVVCGFVGL